jgi:uncharacterized membrane protein
MTVLTKHWPPLLVILLSLLGSYLALPYLPPTIPVHWGLDGTISSYSSKSLGVYLNLGGMIVSYLFFSMIPYTDKRRVRELRGIGIYEPLRNTAVFTFAFAQLLVIGIGLGILDKGASYLVGQGSLLLLLGGQAMQHGLAKPIRERIPFLADGTEIQIDRIALRLQASGAIGMIGACFGSYAILWVVVPCAVTLLLELKQPSR